MKYAGLRPCGVLICKPQQISIYIPVYKGRVFVGKKILIVDDEKNIVDILRFNLRKEGLPPSRPMTGEQRWNWRSARNRISSCWM